MKVRRVGFVGTRTENVEATATFFGDVLGLDVLRDDPEWSIFQLPTGQFDLLEIYSPGFDDERLVPSGVSSMVSFVVDDLEGAHAEVREAGHEVSDLMWATEVFNNPSQEGFGWFFVRAPDDHVYVIQCTPD